MNDTTRCFQSPKISRSMLNKWHGAHFMNDAVKSLLHMFCLVDLVVVPFVMESKYRYSILVNHIRINLAIIIITRHSYATARHTELRSVKSAVIIFQSSPISAGFLHFAITARHLTI